MNTRLFSKLLRIADLKTPLVLAACLLTTLISMTLQLPKGEVHAQAGGFKPTCTLPFNSKPTPHPIDSACPPAGDAKTNGGKLQNPVKNNLCATGTPIEISLKILENLHKAVVAAKKFTFGNDGLLSANKTRDALKSLTIKDATGKSLTLGEGNVVTLDAFVLEAKHDDVPLLNSSFKGEGVNCHDKTVLGNDIHIALVESAAQVAKFKKGDKTVECTSVTAEIIPHFRPDTWHRFDSHPKTSPAVNGLPVQGLEVRLTGQLFFDGSHNPAGCTAPRRRSSWEIHPVYTIEVKDGSKFISFDEWAKKVARR